MNFGGWFVPLVILGFDLVFIGVALGGVKIAGLSWRVFGSILVVAGAAVLTLGIWHYMNGPPVDYDSERSDDRFPAPVELNFVVYVVGGLCLSAGLLLTLREEQEAPRGAELE